MDSKRRHPFTPVVMLLTAAAAWTACGGGEPPPSPPPKSSAPPPATTAEPVPPPSASASAAPDPPKKIPRMAVALQDPLSIEHTFGSQPARLELGDKEIATLRIPEDAISQTEAANVTFKIEKQGKTTGVAVGKVYRLFALRPPNDAHISLVSGADPFKLIMPAGSKKDANLALGEVTKDPKGAEKIVWTIVAPKSIDDATNTATFELSALKDYYLHVTTKAATEKK